MRVYGDGQFERSRPTLVEMFEALPPAPIPADVNVHVVRSPDELESARRSDLLTVARHERDEAMLMYRHLCKLAGLDPNG